MRKTGTIMVSMERGVPVQAMRPKVQMSEIMTVPTGTKTPRARLNEASSTNAMRRNVIGGSRKKSDWV